MKILLISDTHNSHPSVYEEDIDILIHLGDATNSGSRREFQYFSEWWDSIEAKRKIFIPGNHEVFYFREIRDKGRDAVKSWLPDNVTVLINEPVEIEGLKCYASSITQPVFKDKLYWAWEEFEEERRNFFGKIPGGLDLLLTHSPPFGVLDQVPGSGSVGCKVLREQVEKVKPKFHVFGHIHEQGGGEMQFNEILCFNVATKKKVLKI